LNPALSGKTSYLKPSNKESCQNKRLTAFSDAKPNPVCFAFHFRTAPDPLKKPGSSGSYPKSRFPVRNGQITGDPFKFDFYQKNPHAATAPQFLL